MIAAMQKEVHLTKSLSEEKVINSIYFGGGTPSLLDSGDIKTLLQATKDAYAIDLDAEVTLEANPDDINEMSVTEWISAGINRLSIGAQSFNETDLQWMNRAHNATQALNCLAVIKSAGFVNYSVDLIYGTPTLDDADWIKNIRMVVNIGVPHISCYALTVEPATALQKMITQKKAEDVDPEKQARHFLMLTGMLEDAGYEHYEISNFALPGYRSRHNSSYWQRKSYTGIGPSAHSYFGNTRRWNISNNALYIKAIQNNIVPFEEEQLSVVQSLNEYIMTSLRTAEGLDLAYVEKCFGADKAFTLESESIKFQQELKLKSYNKKLILTKEGKLFADGIAADLFFS